MPGKPTYYLIKWPLFTETGKVGSGKNPKCEFLLLGLKYILRTCFDYKKKNLALG